MNNFIYQSNAGKNHRTPFMRESEHSRVVQGQKHPDPLFVSQEERMMKLGERPRA